MTRPSSWRFSLLELFRKRGSLSLVFRMLIFRSIWPQLVQLQVWTCVQYCSHSSQSNDNPNNDIFLTCRTVLAHLQINAENSATLDNLFWGSCPGLHPHRIAFHSKYSLRLVLTPDSNLATLTFTAGPAVAEIENFQTARKGALWKSLLNVSCLHWWLWVLILS
jgi:hypothetical protein